MTVYNLKINTLSPLHIGAGQELRQLFDFVVHNGRTYRLNEDAILSAKYEELFAGQGRTYPLPGRLLSPEGTGILTPTSVLWWSKLRSWLSSLKPPPWAATRRKSAYGSLSSRRWPASRAAHV